MPSTITTQSLSPYIFAATLKAQGLDKGYIVTLDGNLKISHEVLNPLAYYIMNSPDFKDHEGIFFSIDDETGCSFWAFIHDTHRGPGQGGVRLNAYKSMEELISDGLRLSEGMTYKNALAHLWWGGGKGIIDDPMGITIRTDDERRKIFENYGKFCASLNGYYIAAEDMNTTTEDMRILHAHCRHCTCLPEDMGGSGNPSPFTARGIQRAMEAAIHFLYGKTETLKGKHVAVQGAGNVGFPLIKNLLKSGAKITAADTNPETREVLKKTFKNDPLQVIEPQNHHNGEYIENFMGIECDILSPCAIGAVINEKTIPLIKAKIIAGAANNQLKNSQKNAQALHKRGILYLPDYVINRMGITNCANEMYGYLREDIEKATEEVYPDTMHILQKAYEKNITPFEFADLWAKEEAKIPHPIWGHRGKKILIAVTSMTL